MRDIFLMMVLSCGIAACAPPSKNKEVKKPVAEKKIEAPKNTEGGNKK